MSTDLSNLLQQNIPHTFFELLSRYRIAIPCLQRHYVQGENTSKARDVLSKFLADLFDKFADNDSKQLHFIFGPLDTRGADTFQPVDGQQRLTTIWLLSRYAVAWLSDAQDRASMLQLLSRFTYQERAHAERFLQRLTDENRNDEEWRLTPSEGMYKYGLLNSGWREDRTVSSMLNTLDAIAKIWEMRSPNAAEFLTWIWKKLTFHVRMEHFSDDLYMKMNARGLPLTQWEKAKGNLSKTFDEGCNFNRRIEELSNIFFTTMKCLPDDAFFALFGRIVHYLQTVRNEENPQNNELTALARTNWHNGIVNLPYTPVEQLKTKDMFDSKCQYALLDMMEYILISAQGVCLPQWDGVDVCPLGKVVFHPENKDQRDLSLVLFEYFLLQQRPSHLDSFKHSLRLFWNVLGEQNVPRPEESVNSPYERVTSVRNYFIQSSSSQNLYVNSNGPDFPDKAPEQYREEALKMDIYQNSSEWPESALNGLHQAEAVMHGRIRIVLDNLQDSRLCQSRIAKLNCLGEDWEKAIEEKDEEKKQALMLCVMMAMPYWPKSGSLPLRTDESALRNLLRKNEDTLATSLLDFLCNNIQITPNQILKNNQDQGRGFYNRPEYQQEQIWRRDWQTNLLCLYEKNHEQIWGKSVERHGSSNCFYLYQNEGGYISSAIPLNDYRFDFIGNESLGNALHVFYDYVNAQTQGMKINDSARHSTIVFSRTGKKRHLYFYHDHVTVSYCTKNGDQEKWSPEHNVVFNGSSKSIFAPDELTARVNEFFDTIREAINSEFFDHA